MTDHMVDLEAALDAAIDERDAARREAAALAGEAATLRRMALAVADHLDAGHPPGAAIARAIGMSAPLTDREMAGAIRGLCGVRRG